MPAEDFPERKAVENALLRIESEDAETRKEFDEIFYCFFGNGRRNVNAVSLGCYISASSVYRRLELFRKAVEKELESYNTYTAVTVLRS